MSEKYLARVTKDSDGGTTIHVLNETVTVKLNEGGDLVDAMIARQDARTADRDRLR